MSYETELWPYIPARDVGAKRSGPVELFVVHVAQSPETAAGAENLGRYFQKPDYPSSTHIGVDSDTIVQYVKDSYVAYGAKGANHNAIHMEITGMMQQSRKQWLDKFSILTLALAADAAAQYCLKYSLPPVQLTDDELRHGWKGIVGHDQVSRVFKQSDHTDPGPNFPWKRYIAMVGALYNERRVA